jgi:sodium transport system permease protein
MNLAPLKIIARKEFTDGVRDRRSIYTLIATTLFGALVIGFMLNQIAGQRKSAEVITVAVTGGEFAPVLVNWMSQQSGVTIVSGPSNPEEAVRQHKADVVLVIDKDFASNFGQSKSADVKIFSDSTRRAVQPALARVKSLLSRFNGETASLRLIVRGVSPEVAAPLKVEDVDLSNSQQRAAQILNVILMLVAMSVMTAGMQIATDSTAGERERHSLEPLLLNPVPRWQIITGKWLAACGAAFLGMVASLTLFSVLLSKLPLEDAGIRFHLGKPEILMLIAALAPLALLVPAILAYVSCFARSFKEAQSYSVFLVLPVAFTGVVSTFYSLSGKPWLAAIPLLSQYAFASDVMAGRTPPPLLLIGAAVESAVIAAIFLRMAARLFEKEKIIFGH